MARYMSPAEREVVSREQERDYESDLDRSRSTYELLFGDVEPEPAAAPSPSPAHVTSVERGTGSYAGFIFKCSCHAFGKWRRKESEAAADAKAHEAKPWAWKDRL